MDDQTLFKLNSAGNVAVASSLADAASPVIFLSFSVNLSLNLCNHRLYAAESFLAKHVIISCYAGALHTPSFSLQSSTRYHFKKENKSEHGS